MRKNLPPNVYAERSRHGKRKFYYREGKGPRAQLPPPNHDLFKSHLRAAECGEPIGWSNGAETTKTPLSRHATAREGSIAHTITRYKSESPQWLALAAVTKANRNAIFHHIVEKSGARAMKDVRQQDILIGRNKRNIGAGHSANAYLKAIRPLFAFALKIGIIQVNPCIGVDYIEAQTDGYHTWTLEEVGRFETRHPLGTMANLALKIFLYTGLRRQDAVSFGRQHIRNGVWEVRPQKTKKSTGVVVTMRMLEPLQEAIDATKTGEMVFLLSDAKKPFASAASFGNWFADRCVEAGVPGRGHGLRKAGATLAAENGASAHELMAMFGWTKLAQAEVYTRRADRRKLGLAASDKLLKVDK